MTARPTSPRRPQMWLQRTLRSGCPRATASTAIVSLALLGCGPAGGSIKGTDGDSVDAGIVSPTFDPLVCGDWLDGDLEVELTDGPTAAPPECSDCPRFVDITNAAGLHHHQYAPTDPASATCLFDDGESPAADCQLQWFSGGVAAGDVDGDGLPELFFTRLGAPDVLYQNLGDGRFEDVSAQAGFDACTFSNGAAFADVDGDGDLDLVVTALGDPHHWLYINDGQGHFREEGLARGVALPMGGPHGGQGIAVGDYDRDGDLDLHIDEWLRPRNAPAEPTGPLGPRLLRNDGTGHFEDTTETAGVSMAGRRDLDSGVYGFASAFVDLDLDGWPDLTVAADFQTSALFWNRGDGSFEDGTTQAGVNDEQNAMGSTFGDYDRDGDLDWFVTAIAQRAPCSGSSCGWIGTGNRLYENRGDRTFAERSEVFGLRDAGWGWGAGFFDFDADGDLDLAATNGWPGPDLLGSRMFVDDPLRLWVAQPAGFAEQAELRGAADPGQGRGLLPIDLDLDGDLDLVIARHAQRPALLKNVGPGGHWLTLEVVADAGSAPSSPGAVVRVWPELGDDPLIRHVGADAHLLAQAIGPVHVGLGLQASVARIEIHWPTTGRTLRLENVGVDQRLVVRESDAD